MPAPPSFPVRPATAVVHRRSGDEVWIGFRVRWEPESEPPIVLIVEGMGEERYFPLGTLDAITPWLWDGTLYGTDVKVTVRETYESDALTSITTAHIGLPLPIPVIAAMHSPEGTTMDFHAMTDDDGFVATMMLVTDAGIYLRYGSAWHLLTDLDAVDGLSVHEVAPSALDMFDQFDRAGQMVHVTSMPSADGESLVDTTVPADLSTGPTPEVPPAVTAGARAVPTLASIDDLPSAVAAAKADPDLQWWVSRRVRAMGLDVELPWE